MTLPPSSLCSPEPSYETVSPMLCPPLENCSLSGNDCPYGFHQDKSGCLLCQCLNSKFYFLTLCWTSRVKFQGITFRRVKNWYVYLPVCCYWCQKNLATTWFWLKHRHADIHHCLSVSLQGSLSRECSREHSKSCFGFLMDCCAHDQMTSLPTLSDDSCPDLGKSCSLQCPMGYERDDFGCEVCKCSIPTPKCRPLTCAKTCPYGYVYV